MTAIDKGHLEIVKALLKKTHKSKLNERSGYGWFSLQFSIGITMLMNAAKNGGVGIIKELLDRGAKVDSKNA